jgi:N-methylhydantoinase A
MIGALDSQKDIRVGVDIGGTFTDIVLSTEAGDLFVGKVSTTPHDQGIAVAEGLGDLLRKLSIDPARVAEIVHGTTVGSNTILQRQGARTGVLTTKGFRDVLEIGRIRTPGMFDLAWEKPEPLSPRRHRLELDERIGADGAIVRALDAENVLAAGRLFAAEGIEAVAICLINSYVNPVHEQEAARILRQAFPGLRVTASCEVLPEAKEYERTSTTVVNAYLLPQMQTYLARLSRRLAEIGVTAPIQIMASNGGMMGAELAADLPVFAVASGPAGGVTGAAALSKPLGHDDLIVFDMGGTTAKASIIEGGQPSLVTEYEFRDGISSPSRFIKGGGYMLKVPAIDIAEVGAGGGSLASIDAGGLLLVGPQSAGADPGPACYDRGNGRPTVTDANLCLGYLNPEALAGGSLKISKALAERALLEHVGTPLGLSLADAAHGVRQVANVSMARAIRSVTVERGKDPRDMAMIAFGGGGPLHACDVARILGIRRVFAPVMSGVFSAAGMLTADVEHNFVRVVLRRLESCSLDWLHASLAGLREQGAAVLRSEGYEGARADARFAADLRYLGQSSELTIPFDATAMGADFFDRIAERFQAEYLKTYGYNTGEPVEFANLRLTAIGVSEKRLRFDGARIDGTANEGATGSRPVSFDRGQGFVETPLLARADVDTTVRLGPAIIESYDTTIVVPPGARFSGDAIGNIMIDLSDAWNGDRQ